MASFKQLTKSDVFTVPYVANKQFNFVCSNATSSFVTFYEGEKYSGSFSLTEATTSYGKYKRLVFDTVNHIFYQSYSGSLLNTHSLMMTTTNYESASQYRPSSSYFIYNDKAIKSFPTSSGNEIQYIQISQEAFGEGILPYSFQIRYGSGQTTVKDDGFGNLYSGSTHVGNVFYSHGAAIFTNQNFQALNFPVSVSFQNQYTVYENYISCKVNESDFNLSYNPTLIQNNSSSLVDFATGSTFSPYVTTLGLYNEQNELLMVAKFAQPILISSETDMTFLIRYDS